LPHDVPQGRFAVRILFENKDQSLFPIGAQGAAAIYTGGGAYAALRRIVIRSYSWWNWIYPCPSEEREIRPIKPDFGEPKQTEEITNI